MKTGSFWSWSLGVGLVALPLIGGCLRTVPPPAKPVAATEPTIIETDPDITVTPPPGGGAAPPLILTNVEEARVQPLPAQFVLPPNVQPNKSLTDLIRLAQSGADEGVLLTFVTNSHSPFNPGADDLIYLKDIGVPGNVVSAMLKRDEQLKGTLATTPNAPAPAPAAAPEPAPYAAAPAPVSGPEVTAEAVPPSPDYAPEPASPPTEVVYPDFYNSLAPYGSWVDVDGYGYCWQPAVACVNPGWQPYFNGGYWVYTDCGWYWRSDYTWGWAPFHYGRWFHHDHWGWCWRPDGVWGPSWVCWRHNDTHCGWAPLPPGVHFTAGVGLTGSLHPVTQLSPQHFQFVEWRYFRDHELAQHAVSRDQGNRIYGQTTVSTRIIVTHGRVNNDGLSPERVSLATHTTVTRVSLQDVKPTATVSTRPDRLDASGHTLSVYRPQVTPVTVNRGTPPGRVPVPKPMAVAQPGAGTAQSFAPATTTPATSSRTATGQYYPKVPQQPAAPSHEFRATSRYYQAPGNTAVQRWPQAGQSRFEQANSPAPEVPQYHSPVNEHSRQNLPDTGRNRFQVPPTSAPEVPRYNPGAVEHSRHEAPPVERPSRAEPAESHASHASAPAPSSPAPSHSSSSSDHSDHSDNSSHGRR